MPRSPASGRSQVDDAVLRLVKTAHAHVGRGLFARCRIAAGTVVGEIRGDICDEHPADPTYCMELPSGRLLEPAAPFRFLNHCCDPNCELFYWCDDDGRATHEDRLWVQTVRDIECGEELLIDYAWPADAAIPCLCGAANCRGWIVDPDEWHLLPAPTEPTRSRPDAPPGSGPGAGDLAPSPPS